jgi:hypothetical protein
LVAAGVLGLCLAAARLPAAPPIRDDRHIAARHVWDWQRLKQRNIVMQQRDYSCGAAALATIMRYHFEDPVTEDQVLGVLDNLLTLEEIKDRIENGLAMSDLRKAAVKMGYQSAVAKMTMQKLFEAKTPLVVGIEEDGFKHFVVYRGTDRQFVYLADPIRGNLRLFTEEFGKQWQKNLALAIAKPNEEVRTVSPLTVRWNEKALGWTNDQLISTVPSRGVTYRGYNGR